MGQIQLFHQSLPLVAVLVVMMEALLVKTAVLVVVLTMITKQQQDLVLLDKAIMGVLGIKYLLAEVVAEVVLAQLEQQLLLTVLVMVGREQSGPLGLVLIMLGAAAAVEITQAGPVVQGV
jgi:hypothetical protein